MDIQTIILKKKKIYKSPSYKKSSIIKKNNDEDIKTVVLDSDVTKYASYNNSDVQTVILDDNPNTETVILDKHNDSETIFIDRNLNCKSNILNSGFSEIKTVVLDKDEDSDIKTMILEYNKPKTNIKEFSKCLIISDVDNIYRNIFIKKMIFEGSFNKIYNISKKNTDKIDNNLIIRILNNDANVDTIKNEIKGIKIQKELCSNYNNIGIVVDNGIIDKNNQYYFILAKYGITLTQLLKSNVKYRNLYVVIDFMYNLLLAINNIHNDNIAHLDLKPCNILMKNIYKNPNKKIDYLDFVIIDFGAAKKFNSDVSLVLNEQMASAAFSPPELLKMKFGKKSDIWAYGIICYLVCIRKFFFEANASEIFMNDDSEKLKIQIEKGLKDLHVKIIPPSLNKTKSKYIYPLHTVDTLVDFFKKIFVLDLNKRPTSKELLSHKLFTFL